MGNPILPLKPASFAAACPGMAADVVDENGRSVRNQVGELVIRAPWIGMTRGFWRDEQRYLDTYWSSLRTSGCMAICRHRRGRHVVHPRPLRRHHQGGRQTP
jgi:acyl-coenzyme A synthetase/AMP-(fatty) acid ligase